jgi:hypothetical protein
MVLQVNGLNAEEKQDQKLLQNVHDDGYPSSLGLKIEVHADERLPAGATARTWLIKMDVAGLPANSTQKRSLDFDLAGKSYNIEYTLTNQALANFSWVVKAPTAIAIEPGQSIPVTIAVGPVPATAVSVIGSYLLESTGKSLIAQSGLKLCRNPAACDSEPQINLPARSAAQLWLVGASGIGQFDGTITIATTEKPEGDAVTLTVYSTTTYRHAWGIATILLGVLLAWGVAVFGRNLLNRDQMLLPAARLRQRLNTLRAILGTDPTGGESPHIADKITELLNRLEPAALTEAGLPGKWPSPLGAPSSDQLERFRRTMQEIADWLAALEVLIHDGLQRIWPRWPNATAVRRQAIRTAQQHVDAVANVAAAPTPDAARQSVQAQLAAVDDAFGIAPLGGGAPPPRSYEQLNMQIAAMSLITWAVVIAATTVVGTLALVLNNKFGRAVDFLTCLAWGLGVPIGQAAMSATLGTVGNSLGITMPK